MSRARRKLHSKSEIRSYISGPRASAHLKRKLKDVVEFISINKYLYIKTGVGAYWQYLSLNRTLFSSSSETTPCVCEYLSARTSSAATWQLPYLGLRRAPRKRERELHVTKLMSDERNSNFETHHILIGGYDVFSRCPFI